MTIGSIPKFGVPIGIRTAQPQSNIPVKEGFGWCAGQGRPSNLSVGVGIGGEYFNGATTTVGTVPFVANNKFTVVCVLLAPTPSVASSKILRIGGAFDGLRIDLATTGGSINGIAWTFNVSVNLTPMVLGVSAFSSAPFVSICSVNGTLGGTAWAGVSGNSTTMDNRIQSVSTSTPIFTPTNFNVSITGAGAGKWYGIFVIPRTIRDQEARNIVRNPWQLFGPPKQTFQVTPSSSQTVQPLDASYEIDWSNPITAGLVGLIDGSVTGHKGDMITNTIASQVSGPYFTPSGNSFGGTTTGLAYPRLNAGAMNWDITSPIMSMVTAFHPKAHGSSAGIAYNGMGTGTGYSIYSHFSDGTPVYTFTESGPSTKTVYGVTGEIKLNQMNVSALTSDGSNVRGYTNGVLSGTAATTGANIVYDATYHRVALGGATGDQGGLDAAVHYAGLWKRTLSLAEIKSLNANPWQLFKAKTSSIASHEVVTPRKSYMLGGTSPTPSSVAILGFPRRIRTSQPSTVYDVLGSKAAVLPCARLINLANNAALTENHTTYTTTMTAGKIDFTAHTTAVGIQFPPMDGVSIGSPLSVACVVTPTSSSGFICGHWYSTVNAVYAGLWGISKSGTSLVVTWKDSTGADQTRTITNIFTAGKSTTICFECNGTDTMWLYQDGLLKDTWTHTSTGIGANTTGIIMTLGSSGYAYDGFAGYMSGFVVLQRGVYSGQSLSSNMWQVFPSDSLPIWGKAI